VRTIIAIATILACAGCAVHHVQKCAPLQGAGKWAMLPVQNHAETPLAGERAESILATLMRIRGVGDLRMYPAPEASADLPDLDERHRFESALTWAKKEGFAYGITGSVNEWRYRSGPDGEPAVGLSLEIIDVANGKVLWSASGAQAGWGSDTVSGTAEKLLGDLVAQLELR